MDQGSLRFLDVEDLEAFLHEAGFEIETYYGDWARGPLAAESANIVVVARRV